MLRQFCDAARAGLDLRFSRRSVWPTMTQELVREFFDLDESTGILYWKKTGNGFKAEDVAGWLEKHIDEPNRWRIKFEGRKYSRSRLVFFHVYGWLPKEIDHRDRNTLNDRPGNLRPASKSQNQANKIIPSKTGRPKGVSLTGCKKNPYRSKITVNGTNIHIGCFPTIEAAHMAYCLKAMELHGAYARCA